MSFFPKVRSVLLCSGMLLVQACAFFPVSGPSSDIVETGRTVIGPDFGLVQLSPEALRILIDNEPRGLTGTFTDQRPPPEIKFGIGDVITVTIFEAAAGGLFIPAEAGVRPGNFVQLPNQPIDTSGNIQVPYAGLVRAVGLTPSQVATTIVNAIKARAIEPQVIVALANQNTSLISVLGEVNAPARLPALPAGEHILDSITRASGIKDQGYETWVTLERQGRRASVPFASLLYEPGNNIWSHAGDTIYVFREPQTFLAFGAAGQQGQIPFGQWRLSLSEAVAKAGGLLDTQADPASVYLYRREPRALATKLGVDLTRIPGPLVPIIYKVNMRDPAGYFVGTKFAMRNKDILFAANAPSVEIGKFLQFVQLIVATGSDITVAGTNATVLRTVLR